MSDIIGSMFAQQLQNEVDTLTPARLICYASTNNLRCMCFCHWGTSVLTSVLALYIDCSFIFSVEGNLEFFPFAPPPPPPRAP